MPGKLKPGHSKQEKTRVIWSSLIHLITEFTKSIQISHSALPWIAGTQNHWISSEMLQLFKSGKRSRLLCCWVESQWHKHFWQDHAGIDCKTFSKQQESLKRHGAAMETASCSTYLQCVTCVTGVASQIFTPAKTECIQIIMKLKRGPSQSGRYPALCWKDPLPPVHSWQWLSFPKDWPLYVLRVILQGPIQQYPSVWTTGSNWVMVKTFQNLVIHQFALLFFTCFAPLWPCFHYSRICFRCEAFPGNIWGKQISAKWSDSCAFAQLGACLSDPWSRHTFQNTVIPALPWFHPQIHTLPDWYWHLLFHFPTTWWCGRDYVKTNVVPSLVSRFAIVAKIFQIIQSPSNVWKVHYCGKNSWETIVLSKKMFMYKKNSEKILLVSLSQKNQTAYKTLF